MNVVKISVRNLVEFIMRSGDLDNRRNSNAKKEAMQQGSRIHRKIQKSKGEDYKAEYSLKYEIEREGIRFLIEGRADGIFVDDSLVTIDEIKGVYMDVVFMKEPVLVHKAQAMCYAFFYANQNELEKIQVQMTYCNIETEQIKYFREVFSFEDLKVWFYGILDEYIKWAKYLENHIEERDESIKGQEFPFEYRSGQREIAVSVYRSIARNKNLFIQAPTGVGKTMSTLFPAIKSLGEGISSKVFYLTAKTITRSVALDAIRILDSRGFAVKTVILTAKDKICMNAETDCNPISCAYAKGHYDRVNDAVYDLINNENLITRETIIEYAKRYNVCPFEMSLDVTEWVDVVIGDYNYAFDPNVSLKRYFSEGNRGEYVFLVDEAHNLVERAREMYSASIYKEDFLKVKKIIGEKDRRLTKLLEKCNRDMLEYKRECDECKVFESVGNMVLDLLKLITAFDTFFDEVKEFEGRKEALELYLNVWNFLNIHDLVDENYIIYGVHDDDGRFMIKLLCINTSKNLQNYIKKGISAVFFSATLLPVNYYKKLLSGCEDDYAIYIDSPFSKDNRVILAAKDVSSRYTRRNQNEFNKICSHIEKVVSTKRGNYMVFLPSYMMLDNVSKTYKERYGDKYGQVIVQKANMGEDNREEFLMNFTEQSEVIAFCVIGGVFSEGIDLKNELLIGSIIVGTGLPMVCTERELLKKFYDNQNMNGFDYAYIYPGINKVLQAAGRVIRTDEDRGVITLLDDRFMSYNYKRLFPREWDDIKVVDVDTIESVVEEFWNKLDN